MQNCPKHDSFITPFCPVSLQLCSPGTLWFSWASSEFCQARVGRSSLPGAYAVSTDSPPNDWGGATPQAPPLPTPLPPSALLFSAAFLPPDNCGGIWQLVHEVSWPLSRLNFTWLFPNHIPNLASPLETQSQSWLILSSPVFSLSVDFISVLFIGILQSF